ncbi:hypothetical protein CON21_22415 [Bacillus thuringiensis]|uniref:ETX/MTX2 family pore-forming toxin n=1 Tax=Bacillus thuringiensis TaxID=1428 RepID=UPI0009AB1888|nr:ETX/MTX2 family pore-forming toxin [Bacillus thuringiensis]MED3529014.1 ETX/MTX2 family pore-forming toxin [Bacillus thuringiensis]PEE98522.1 hypothetical protein CON21_22415 [Bacillus thuringiensis]
MAIFDLDTYLLDLFKKVVDSDLEPALRVYTSDLAVKNEEIYGFEIKESKPQGTMFMGESILNNRTNETQTILSDSFTKTITDSVTLSVTNGITTGVNISISGKIFGMGAETSMSIEVSTSTTNEQTNEESIAYTVPSQTVVVPAQTTYYVHTALERNRLEGIVRLRADLSGEITLYVQFTEDLKLPLITIDIYDFVNHFQSSLPLPSGISLNHNTKAIHFEGIAEYLYGTGTKFHVTVTDKPSSQGTHEHKSFDAKTGLGTYPIGLNGKKLRLDLNDLKEHMNPKDFEKLKELQNKIV